MSNINQYINFIMRMPYHMWWSFRSIKWYQYAKKHNKDVNSIEDWFMKDRQSYCQTLYDLDIKHQLAESEETLEKNLKLLNKLVDQIRLEDMKKEIRNLESKLKENE